MQNLLQIKPFPTNELSPNGFITERWELHENQRVGNQTPIPFSFSGLCFYELDEHLFECTEDAAQGVGDF